MAILNNGELSFEFVFKELDDCLWVQYEFWFRWRNEYVFRDDLLKRWPETWAGRSEGALRANESDDDTFVRVLERAIESTSPVCWQPMEPDVIIAFYPDQDFPFIPNRWHEIYTPEAQKAHDERLQRREQQGGKLPDDIITMVVFVDAYNFKGCAPYYGAGFALILTPTREQLATFCRDLKAEYGEFAKRERIEARLAERAARDMEDSDGDD